MRKGASVSHDLQVSFLPRGARTGRGLDISSSSWFVYPDIQIIVASGNLFKKECGFRLGGSSKLKGFVGWAGQSSVLDY
jgi:hypothetical protein